MSEIQFRSDLEKYFSMWLDELVETGYIQRWTYEEIKYPLFEGLKLPYKKQLKTKVSDELEHIFEEASFTEDFCIYWDKKAENIFYLNPNVPISVPVKTIPFRLGNGVDLVSYVDVKSTNESTTSSSVSYPYKAKWTYQKYGILIHKIYPFSLSKAGYKKTLFYNTFTPKKVIASEVYTRDCKWGNAGTTKIKYPIITLEQFLKRYSL